jgi:beta-phosphoglucomutase-like phosphatase (HAD superfamily)
MRPPPLPHQIVVLDRVLERAMQADGAVPPLVVFDLDGTLYDNRPRTVQILEEYADEVADQFPEVAEALAGLTADAVHYLLSDTLRARGLTKVEIVSDATRFWRERFFAEKYLKYDAVKDGAVEFARHCHEAGAVIVYLAGRDVTDLLPGTVTSLRKWGFPVGEVGVELVLKPDATLSDEAFKRASLPVLRRVGRVVAFFDNEPANCNVARHAWPEALVGLIETQSVPGAPEIEPGVETIRDFRRV